MSGEHRRKKDPESVNWTVKGGERWVLLGRTVRKTTLLSLITPIIARLHQELSSLAADAEAGRASGISKGKLVMSPRTPPLFFAGRRIINTIPVLYSRSAAKYDSMSCLDVLLSGFRMKPFRFGAYRSSAGDRLPGFASFN